MMDGRRLFGGGPLTIPLVARSVSSDALGTCCTVHVQYHLKRTGNIEQVRSVRWNRL